MCLFLQMALAQDGNQEQSYAMPPVEQTFHSERSLIIGNERIDLDVEAGTMKLRSETNEPIALFGFTYYAKKNEPDKKNRPIVFAFNGGPGSSSFWLHMGVLGPTRIVVNDPGRTPAAPYILEDNAYSILDVADLVMMDPIGTGLSIPIGKATFKDFWGVDQDIRSLSLFITQFLIREGRMNSPKYLLGESYGTFRNAGLMNYMLNQGIAMNGVIMVSAVFDLRTLLFPPNDDLPYLVHFPTYAATAWYHNKIDNKTEDLFDFLDEIRAFTENEYMPALYRGDQLSQAEKSAMAQKLSHYTGLSQEYWIQSDLRVTNSEFFQELMRDQGETVGRLDSRFTGINQDLLSQTASYDPQSIAISPAYITGFMDYFFGQLGVAKDLTYMVTAGRRDGFAWDWKHKGNMAWGTIGAINTGIDMAEALTKDPNMKVLVLNGIYDLATVFYGVEYSINHLGLPPDIKKNIIMEYYEAGHMMYTHQPSLEKFKKDVADFILMTSK